MEDEGRCRKVSWILRIALKCCCEDVGKWLSGGLSWDLQHPHQKPGTVAHDCNLSSGEAETRRIPGACWPSSIIKSTSSGFSEKS